jgi:selenium metabolism protein YedF
MDITTVDACGLVCPKPLVMTKAALVKLAVGEEMDVLVDNETSKQNIERFLKDNGAGSSCSEHAGVFTLRIQKLNPDLPRPAAEDYCVPTPSNAASPAPKRNDSAVILFKSRTIGSGPEELGSILMKAFINTIKEISPLPSALVFYTDGVHLAVDGSAVLDSLREIEGMGIKMFVCGTCLDYFKIKDSLKVGVISNMYTILETLSKAHHVIAP